MHTRVHVAVTGTDGGTYVITAARWTVASHLSRTSLEVEIECVGQAEATALHLLRQLWEILEREDPARLAFRPKGKLPAHIPIPSLRLPNCSKQYEGHFSTDRKNR